MEVAREHPPSEERTAANARLRERLADLAQRLADPVDRFTVYEARARLVAKDAEIERLRGEIRGLQKRTT